MYENVYGKTSPRFGENAVTLSLDVDRPCFSIPCLFLIIFSKFQGWPCSTTLRQSGGGKKACPPPCVRPWLYIHTAHTGLTKKVFAKYFAKITFYEFLIIHNKWISE